MAYDEFRLLAAAVMLERFTADELAAAAQANPHTARSWLRRQAHLLEKTPGSARGRGAPRKVISLKPGAAETMRQQLDEVRSQTDRAALETEQRRLLASVERRLKHWQTFNASALSSADPQLTALRVAIRLAWREFARLQAAGQPVEVPHLRHLAEIEHAARVVEPPMDDGLQPIAFWLGERLTRLSKQSVEDGFALRTMWARADVRSEMDRRKITAAALGAPVWSDEGLARNEVNVDVLLRCRGIAELVPLEARLMHVSRAIRDNGASLCGDDGEAQAVVRGVTACADAKASTVRDWLAAADRRGDWRPALAPMIIHGLLNSDDLILGAVMDKLREPLVYALENRKGTEGRLRSEAFDFSRRALGHALLGTTPVSVVELPGMARRFGSASLPSLTDPGEAIA
jgi:hypothetical protein